MIYLKVHETENGDIIAMCDQALIDKVLEEGKIMLDIKRYAEFYKGTLINGEEFQKGSRKVISANIVGREAIDAAIENMLIDEGHVKTVAGIPYAHAYRV
ncbi:DUF424 family protein [Candidatus Marsarchaeota archaeon]|nr:DUF424 family protein [Candidatus Marsarchaeota archaeon]